MDKSDIEQNPYASPVHVDAVVDPDWPNTSLFQQAGRIYIGHWPQFALLLLLLWWPIEALNAFLQEHVFNPNAVFDSFLIVALDWSTVWLPEAAVLCLVRSIVLGQNPAFSPILKQAIGIWLWMMWTNLIASVLITLGMVLLIIPGIFLSIKFLFTDAIVVNERVYGTQAMRRSFDLTTGHFMPLFGLAVFMIAVFIVSSTLLELIPMPFPDALAWIWDSFLIVLVSGLAIYPTICLFLFYWRISGSGPELDGKKGAEIASAESLD